MFIVIGLVAAGLIGLGGYSALRRPAAPPPTGQGVQPASGTDSLGDPLPADTQEQAFWMATEAARAYAAHPFDETPERRHTRLKPFFLASSPVLTAGKYISDPDYNTGKITTLSTEWRPRSQEGNLAVLVYLLVDTQQGSNREQAYQGWNVELKQTSSGGLAAATIELSSLPYIMPRSPDGGGS